MTNATAHTPGSWGVLETCHETRPWSVTDEQDCTIAMVVQNPLDEQNTSGANARLIAAAPDLLAIAEATAHLPLDGTAIRARLITAAIEAVAKATVA